MSIWYLIVPAAALGAKALFGQSAPTASVDELAAKAVPIAQQEIAKGIPAAQAIDYAAKVVQAGTVAKAQAIPPPSDNSWVEKLKLIQKANIQSSPQSYK